MDFFSLLHYFFIPFFGAAALTLGLVPVVRAAALRFSLLDRPETDPARKIHSRPMPLLGGLAIFLGFTVLLIGYSLFTDLIPGGSIRPKHLAGIVIAGGLLMVGGFLDDKYNMHPLRQMIWPVAAISSNRVV